MHKDLVKKIKVLKKGPVSNQVKRRMEEFYSLGSAGINEIFKELCFCILTANFSAERGIYIQKAIGDGFLTLSEKQLSQALRSKGYRFPNTRASYIVNARSKIQELKDALSMEPNKLRSWLVENIRGFGYKEASHFLRNIGFDSFAIIDFHIMDLLVSEGFVPKYKTITPKRYIFIEKKLSSLAKQVGIALGELDLYLWYLETGKILK